MQIILPAKSQCKTGNCINGKGKMDFGWCVYEGNFVNGQAEGNGSMMYADYTYQGGFKNGMEDGDGVIVYKDGRKENVHYVNGQKSEDPIKLSPGEYKPLMPQDKNCLLGDCINGFGTYQYTGGNKYVGYRVDYKMEGKGVFYFKNGDKLDAVFHNNIPIKGTYTYINGIKYIGTYDSNGKELNGDIISYTGAMIPYVNGKPIIPEKPQVDKTAYKDPRVKFSRNSSLNCSCCQGYGVLTLQSLHINSNSNYYNSINYFQSRCNCCKGSGDKNDQKEFKPDKGGVSFYYGNYNTGSIK